MTVRRRLEELLNDVQYRRGRVLITKAGKPVAALVDIETLERLRDLDQEFDHLRREMAAAFSSQSEENINTCVDQAVAAARRRPSVEPEPSVR